MKKIPEQVWVFAGAFVFFLLTLAENFSGPHDSITYLNGIADGYPLVNQHHLLYHYAAYCWLHIWQPIFPSVKEYYIIETFSSFWGSCSLAVVYSFFRNRFNFSRVQALAGILVIAFSYAFWFYSINIEVYAPPLFFILLALYFITQEKLSNADWWKIILLHVLAIVFHQVNALFVVVVLYKMWQQRKHISIMRWVLAYSITGLVLVGGAYFIVGWIIEQQNTLDKWFFWMRGYAGGSVFWYPLSTKTPVDVSYGFSHSLLGGHYVFQLPPVKKLINASLSSHSLGDELYIARNISTSMAIFLSAITGILAAIMLWLLIRFIKNGKLIAKSYKVIVIPLLLAFFVYSAFFTFWMPEILEFWILQSVVLWLLLLGTVPMKALPYKMKPAYLYGIIAGLLFTINYFGSIRWMRYKENDLYYVKAMAVQSATKQNDLVLLQDGWILKDFFAYFTRVQVQPVPMKDSSRVMIDSLFSVTLTKKAKVFILPEVNNKLRSPDFQYLDSLRKQYAGRLSLFRQKDPEIWVIE